MNRLNSLMLAGAATLMLTASAFKKDNQTVQPDSNSATLAFVGKSLVMTSFQVSPVIDLDADGKLDSDLTVFLRDCDKDNSITFEKEGVMSGSNGNLSCSDHEVASPIAKSSHWTYDPSTKTIRIVKDNDATDVSEWKVLEASANSLKVEISVAEPTRSYKTITSWKSV